MSIRKYKLIIHTRMKTFKFRNVTGYSSVRNRDGDASFVIRTTKGIKRLSFNDDNLLWIKED